MPITNGDFETASGTLGVPASWTLVVLATAEHLAAFGPAPRKPEDAFEAGWDNDGAYFSFTTPIAPGEAASALFNTTESKEDFEEGWSNTPFSTTLPTTTAASFDTGVPETYEDFEEEWTNTPFLSSFAPGDIQVGTFDTANEAYEDFEEEWENDTYLTSFAPGDIQVGVFDFQNFENFESVRFDRIVTVDPGTDTFTDAAHPHQAGDPVTFRMENGGLPAGINPVTVYSVINTAVNTFQVSATLGGAAIDVTSAGTGTLYVVSSPALFWTEPL